MSSPSSLAFALTPRLRPFHVKTSLVGWGAYMVCLTAYCMLYQGVVSGTPPDLPGSIVWSLREWALWWFMTPLALNAFRRYERLRPRRLVPYLRLAAAVLLTALAYRVAVDYFTDARGVASILIVFAPRYVAALAAIFLFWYFVLRIKPVEQPDVTTPEGNVAPRRHYPETLLVSKGNDRYPVRVARIDCVSAAGNYVEILSGSNRYLLRSTMKKVEELLPPGQFIRVHRSHIVNLDAVERIRTRASGSGKVILRSGVSVNVGRKYRCRLPGAGNQG